MLNLLKARQTSPRQRECPLAPENELSSDFIAFTISVVRYTVEKNLIPGLKNHKRGRDDGKDDELLNAAAKV